MTVLTLYLTSESPHHCAEKFADLVQRVQLVAVAGLYLFIRLIVIQLLIPEIPHQVQQESVAVRDPIDTKRLTVVKLDLARRLRQHARSL